MNKLEKLYFKVLKDNLKITKLSSIQKSAEITTDIAVKFALFLKDNLYNWEEVAEPQPHNNNNPKTTQELFEIFVNNHYESNT